MWGEKMSTLFWIVVVKCLVDIRESLDCFCVEFIWRCESASVVGKLTFVLRSSRR